MTEARWFASDDVDLVRAGVLLLEAAARSTRPGCLSGDPHILARLAGVSADFWAMRASEVLEGFELVEDGSWRHVAMADLAAAVRVRFGAQLEELAASSVLASQAVDEFPLIGEPKTTGRSRESARCPRTTASPMRS